MHCVVYGVVCHVVYAASAKYVVLTMGCRVGAGRWQCFERLSARALGRTYQRVRPHAYGC